MYPRIGMKQSVFPIWSRRIVFEYCTSVLPHIERTASYFSFVLYWDTGRNIERDTPSLKNERYGLGRNGHVNNMKTCLSLTQRVLNFHTSYENGMITLFLK